MNVSFQVIDTDQRFAERYRQGLAIDEAHQQRPNQSRPLSDCDALDVVQRRSGLPTGFINDGDDFPQMFSGSQFRHNAAEPLVDFDLGGHDVQRICLPSATTAAAVSSQLDSIPRTSIISYLTMRAWQIDIAVRREKDLHCNGLSS